MFSRSYDDTYVAGNNHLYESLRKVLLTITETAIFVNDDLDLHFEGRMMQIFVSEHDAITMVEIWFKLVQELSRYIQICKKLLLL